MDRNENFRIVVSLVACAVLTATFLPAVAVAADGQTTSAQTTTVPVTTSGIEQETNDTSRAEEIIENASERYEEIEDFTAIQETTANYGENTTTTTADFAYMEPDNLRLEYTGDGPQAGTLIVSNGSSTVIYDASNNSVQVIDTAGQNVGQQADAGYLDQILSVLQSSETSYEGTETVAGEETYVVSAEPSSAFGGDVSYTYYLDQETYLPIKQHTDSTFTFNGTETNSESTTVLRNVSVDVGLSNETFDFEVPEGATVLESPVDTTTYESVDAVRENVSVAVTEPAELPEGFGFEQAVVSRISNMTSVRLQYTNESGSVLTASFYTDESGMATSNRSYGESVTVDGQDGTYIDVGEYASVTFQCGDLAYSVNGPFEKETLVDVAASVDCDGERADAQSVLESLSEDERSLEGALEEPITVDLNGESVTIEPADLEDIDVSDVDGDGEVTTADLGALGDVVSTDSDVDLESLDVDGDGDLTVEDLFAAIDALDIDAEA